MTQIEKKIKSLPPEAQRQIIDFIDFIAKRYGSITGHKADQDSDEWLKLTEKALKNIWDNEEDNVYNDLLKR